MANYIVDRDITFCLFKYFNDCDKLNLLSVNKSIYLLGSLVNFRECHALNKIIKSPFFDNFESVIVIDVNGKMSDWCRKLPKKIKKLEVEIFNTNEGCEIKDLSKSIKMLTVRSLGLRSINLSIPCGVENLSLEGSVVIIGDIPHTITKLGLYHYINLDEIIIPKNIKDLTLVELKKDIIPFGIEKLTLKAFHRNTKKFIPKSVIELVLDIIDFDNMKKNFNCGDIPDGIKKLCFGNKFNFKLVGKLPESVTELVFRGFYYSGPIENQLNTGIERIRFGRYTGGLKYDDYFKQMTLSGFNKKINYYNSYGDYDVVFEKISTDSDNNSNVADDLFKVEKLWEMLEYLAENDKPRLHEILKSHPEFCNSLYNAIVKQDK